LLQAGQMLSRAGGIVHARTARAWPARAQASGSGSIRRPEVGGHLFVRPVLR
jgi:hypothetical protein